MSNISGFADRFRGLFSMTKGPWGQGDGDDSTGAPKPRGGPWSSEPGDRPRNFGDMGSLEDLLRRGRARLGGGGSGGGEGGGLSFGPGASLYGLIILAVAALWLIGTSIHSISPGQRGVVSRFGRYYSTLGPGVGFTLPSPIDRVQKLDVESIRSEDLGSDDTNDLMLTGDQNLLDIAYSVRWNVRTPELYLYQLAEPDQTIREVAESSMRAVISQVSLNDAMGDRRADIENQVAERMQRILDSYRSGIQIQGIAIKQADPPDAVNDAFKEVTAAQQEAQSYINNANAYALQLGQKAQGEATAFDKVYEQYKLAPDVTRKRMYYETMEQVLSKVDKTVVEAPGGVTPYLPLPQVQKSQPEEVRQ